MRSRSAHFPVSHVPEAFLKSKGASHSAASEVPLPVTSVELSHKGSDSRREPTPGATLPMPGEGSNQWAPHVRANEALQDTSKRTTSGGPQTASSRRVTSGGALKISRDSIGLPSVPRSPRSMPVPLYSSNGDKTSGPCRRGAFHKGHREMVGSEDECLLHHAAEAGLRGVPCPNCHFVVPLQHIALCAEWHIRQASPLAAPGSQGTGEAHSGALRGGPQPPVGLPLHAPLSSTVVAGPAQSGRVTGWPQPQLQQAEYGGPWRSPQQPVNEGIDLRALLQGGPSFIRGSTLKPLVQKTVQGGSIWGSVPPSFLLSPFNVHTWAA
ncbi:uncharacterized protein LOC34618400 [Cyclospora cayetanensis]|uniref:Uncharacterized protein LOC34618400 n=1 Tax=Cyclospora cayetanensis TaxID=88456 RepID=A0A6P6RTT3_9EIME|nr:uncharacterized protein LOC34618400 [Cyclospora cayetanensis]